MAFFCKEIQRHQGGDDDEFSSLDIMSFKLYCIDLRVVKIDFLQ